MASSESARPGPRKQPKQERSRALFAAIVEGARQVIEERGVEFTLSEVAARAGVSPGSLYQYFPDRRALVGALIDDQIDRDRQEIRAAASAFETATARQLPGLLARGALQLYTRHPNLLLSMVRLMQEVGRHEDLKTVVEEFARILGKSLLRCCPERSEEEALRASTTAVAATLGVVRQTADTNPGELEDPEYVTRVGAIASAALRVDVSG